MASWSLVSVPLINNKLQRNTIPCLSSKKWLILLIGIKTFASTGFTRHNLISLSGCHATPPPPLWGRRCLTYRKTRLSSSLFNDGSTRPLQEYRCGARCHTRMQKNAFGIVSGHSESMFYFSFCRRTRHSLAKRVAMGRFLHWD